MILDRQICSDLFREILTRAHAVIRVWVDSDRPRGATSICQLQRTLPSFSGAVCRSVDTREAPEGPITTVVDPIIRDKSLSLSTYAEHSNGSRGGVVKTNVLKLQGVDLLLNLAMEICTYSGE